MSGTTATAIANDLGVRLEFVICIEGVEVLLTTGDPSAALTAWEGTDWDTMGDGAIGGASIMWKRRQELEPWSPEIKADSMSFSVQDTTGGSNFTTFGQLVFGSGAGSETRLNEDLDCTETHVSALATATFGDNGTIHIGTEAIPYTNTTSILFSPCTRGAFSPFQADTDDPNRFGRVHPMPQVGDGYVTKPLISSRQREWVGRWVGVWAHRVVGSTFDTKAQAQLVWAGKIVGLRDSEAGLTYVDCAGAPAALQDCLLLRQQYVADLRMGIWLSDGMTFSAGDRDGGAVLNADDLVVVASGASGNNEVNAGLYTLDDLAGVVNKWFADEVAASRLNLTWQWNPRQQTPDGLRSRLTWTAGSATDNGAALLVPDAVSRFMGYGNLLTRFVDTVEFDGSESYFDSPETPFRSLGHSLSYIEVENIRGSWFANEDWLPDGNVVPGVADQGIIEVGGAWALVARIDSGTFQVWDQASVKKFGARPWSESSVFEELRADQTSPILVKQIAVLSGPFDSLLTKILASTGTEGYNHATYDCLPAQLGAAIPWELLGDGWTSSLGALAEGTGGITMIIDRPTKLAEKISGDMAARFATVVWKNQGLRVTTWAPPTTAMVEHTFTEQSKARPLDADDDLRTVTDDEDKYLVNQVKLQFNRIPGTDTYRDVVTIVDHDSIARYGAGKPVTIDLCNTYAFGGSDPYLETLVDLVASTLPLFSRPLRLLRVTVNQTKFEGIAPGDVAQISDDHARDPATGNRGLSGKPALVVRHDSDWGGYEVDSEGTRNQRGQVDLLIMNRDRIVAYSPCAQVDETQANGGYNAGTSTLTCYAHQHSESTASVDVSHFVAGDKVLVIEVDPDSPSSYLSWQRTILSVNAGSNTITLTSGLSSPSWDSAKKYRVISQKYSSAQTSQQSKAYQADDADHLVQDVISAYEYGSAANVAATWTADTGAELVELAANDYFGDGCPLDTGAERAIARGINNLVSYRTAPVQPTLYREWLQADAEAVRQVLAIEPFFFGSGHLVGGQRYLNVRLWVKRASAGDPVKLWVSLCRERPTGSSWVIGDPDAPAYQLNGPYDQVEYSVSSTTAAITALGELTLKVVDPHSGIGYIVIEGEENAQTLGLAMCQVGEFEQAA